MSPDVVVKGFIVDWIGWVERMVATIRSLPLEDSVTCYLSLATAGI